VAIRNLAVPVLSGGALVLGYAAFSWLRARRAPVARASMAPRQASLETGRPFNDPESALTAGAYERAELGAQPSEVEGPAERLDTLPPAAMPEGREEAYELLEYPAFSEFEDSSERVTLPGVGHVDFEAVEAMPESERSLEDAPAPEEIGALFLARVTDALSPFGGHQRGMEPVAADAYAGEMNFISEASARAASGLGLEPEEEREESVESERRPTLPGRIAKRF
jgi:hypothetical protein